MEKSTLQRLCRGLRDPAWRGFSRCGTRVASPLLRALLIPAIVLAACAPVLSASQEVRSLERKLRAALRAEDYEAAKSLVNELAATDELDGFRSIITFGLAGSDYALEKEAGYLLASSASGAVQDLVFEEVQESKNFKTRIVLLAVVARWAAEDPRGLEALHAALEDGKKPVVLAALGWLKKLKRKESVPPILDLLETRVRKVRGRKVHVTDRIYYDSLDVLKAITDRDFRDVADWRAFWKAHKDGAIPNPKPKRKNKQSRTSVRRPPSFFNIPVNSDRVLFVIDVSGSMLKTDLRELGEAVSANRERIGKTGVGGGSRGGGGTATEVRVRMRRAQDELIRVIGTLDVTVRFGIMAFSHKMFFWGGSPKMVEATHSNKTAAVGWVNKLEATGFTRTDIAMGHALDVFDVDTVFLLTDGAPQDRNNQRLAVNPILEYVGRQNRFLRCRIHAISFEQIRDTKMRYLVEQISAQNEGRHLYLK